MDFLKIVQRAIDLRRQYEIKETDLYGSPSTTFDIAQGFAGNANNLLKLVRAERGELEIAVNLETAFMKAMDRLETHLLEAE